MVGRIVPPAGMRLIAVGEAPMAIGTGPEWPPVQCSHVRRAVDGSYLFNNAGQFNMTVMAGRSPSLIGVLISGRAGHSAGLALESRAQFGVASDPIRKDLRQQHDGGCGRREK